MNIQLIPKYLGLQGLKLEQKQKKVFETQYFGSPFIIVFADPFVKIIGLPESVSKAKESISHLLKVKKDRITLKMEIGHTSHSHIIGRGGRNTQDVMRETNCHIHFPDSNKHNDIEKNNQVSIAGGVGQVERARSKLRVKLINLKFP